MQSPTPNSDNVSAIPEATLIPGDAARRAQRQKWERMLMAVQQEVERSSDAEAKQGQSRDAVRAEEYKKRSVEAEQKVDELRRQLEQRDDKIRRMQKSFSWQITTPLRALRRSLGKSESKLTRMPSHSPTFEQATIPASRASAEEPSFLWSTDNPRRWEAASPVGFIKGWFVWLPDERPATAIRAKIGDTVIAARMSLPRPDVVAAHGYDKIRARDCGFLIDYRLKVGEEYPVTIEVERDDGHWIVFQRTKLVVSTQQQDTQDYTAWVEAYSRLTPEKADLLRTRLSALPEGKRPLISIVVPVFNTPERWLERSVESVRAQVYENWELCIADDASTAPHIRPQLKRLAKADSRIKVCFRSENGHISEASNSAMELAQGEFIALLDHDDELAPDALAECVLLLAEKPETDIIYTDEDKMDESGNRYGPYFKPDYLPDLEVGQHYLLHLAVYRTALLRSIGGFRAGYEGSQDWDLTLRCLQQVKAEHVHHIPKVLYHWRAISGSTALVIDEKNYAVFAAKLALQDHFAARGIAAEILPVQGCHWQIVHPLPKPQPLVSIIIPTFNGPRLLRMCVASILARTQYENFEVLIVNNRSDDPVAISFLRDLAEEPRVRVFEYEKPFNYSAINNFAVSQARGEILCLLNNDIEVISPLWLDELVSHAVRPEIGAVGAMLYYPNDAIQHAGVILGLGGVAHHAFGQHSRGAEGYMNRARLAQNYSAVTGACLAVRRSAYLQVGGLNEQELAVAFNDIDFCLKLLAAGYRNLWTPFAELYHHESATRGFEDTPEKQARFQREAEYMRRTWGPVLDHDPAYNPNLTLGTEGWSLAWPPRT